MPRFRWLSTVILAVLPVLPLAVPGGHPTRPARSADRSWDLAMTRHYGQPGNASGYSTIVLTGGKLWVFGGTNPGGTSWPVAERLAGKYWVASPLPAGLTDFISDASAPASNDIWAISGYGRYVLHWNGTSWRVARSWSEQGSLTDIVAVGPRSAWVFGTSATGGHSLGTWRYDGRSWHRVSGLASNIYRASGVTGRDVWAIAAGSRRDDIIHFNGRSWHRLPADRAISAIRWRDILAESVRDVWLAGDTASGHLVLAHWNGKRWHRFVTALPALAGQLAAAGPDRVLATATSSALLPTGLVVLMAADGRLTTYGIASSLGSGVSDAVLAARTGSIWASGGTLTRRGGDAAVWAGTLPDSRRHLDDDDLRLALAGQAPPGR